MLEYALRKKGYGKPVLLGQGAFSKVYRVIELKTGRLLACKISGERDMLRREAGFLKELEHPLFPEYMNSWEEREQLFLVMEYIGGESLRSMVERRKGFRVNRSVQIAMELAEGLIYLHERENPIIYRDMKPDNVLIRADGQVKLVDMGCACKIEENNGKRSVAGSKGYAAPEQFRWQECPGRESDVYALGKLLQFMMGNKVVVPKELQHIIYWAVQENRRNRIPDMQTFWQELAKYNDRKGELFKVWQRLFRKSEATEFYYIKNVQKGF